MRKFILRLVESAGEGDGVSRSYNLLMSVTAILSLVPLMSRQWSDALRTIDIVTAYVLFVDYVLRWVTHDLRRQKSGKKGGALAFAVYPFTPGALLSLLSLLPTWQVVSQGFRVLRLLRVTRLMHYSRALRAIGRVLKRERRELLGVLVLALGYIVISALLMFVNEPETFPSFYLALYWATTALTTVGYGDIYPVTAVGRAISMLSSLIGVGVVALPAGIFTAGFMDEVKTARSRREQAPTRVKWTWAWPRGIARTMLTLLVCVALNELPYRLAQALQLPLWLDFTGTVYASLVLGPAAGVLAALLHNMLSAITAGQPSLVLYFFAIAPVALLTGGLRCHGVLRPRRLPLMMLLALVFSSTVAASITLLLYRGASVSDWEWRFLVLAQTWGLSHGAAL